MIKLVSETPVEQVRQVKLEDDVQTAFARAAAAMLEFICSGKGEFDGKSVPTLMQEFIDEHAAAEAASIDPKGIAIKMPSMVPAAPSETDPDKDINTVLRGSLRMVAARLIHRGATDNAEYERALEECSCGVAAISAKAVATRKRKRR